ncbi:hypothetical protein E4U17_001922, partial [Claviceps sp. LM77 group G4]
TEWDDDARSFDLSEAQRAGSIHEFGTRASRIIDHGLPINERVGVTIDTYANIFSGELDAGRNIFESAVLATLSVALDDAFLRVVFVTRDGLELAIGVEYAAELNEAFKSVHTSIWSSSASRRVEGEDIVRFKYISDGVGFVKLKNL